MIAAVTRESGESVATTLAPEDAAAAPWLTVRCRELDAVGSGDWTMRQKNSKRTEPVTTQGLRHARMKIETAVLMSRGGDAFSSEVADISATGVMVQRPQGWNAQPGDLWVLDMLVGEDLNIHVEATVARVTAHHVGFAYARIPDDRQVALWNLLGGYADSLEPWDDE